MAAGKILGMALEAIGKGADEVADVVKSSKSAARKALDAVAEAGDDWGWKGGKPGELTGGEYEAARRKLVDLFGNTSKKNRAQIYKLEQKLLNQVSGSGLENRDMRSLAGDFADLEQADVPREWTGKIVKALGRPLWEVADTSGARMLGKVPQNGRTPVLFSSDIAQKISDVMRPLTNEQRAEFLKELPNWEDSLESLAFFIQNV